MRGSGVTFLPVRSIKSALRHDARLNPYEPHYFLPKEHRLENMAVIDATDISARFARKKLLASARARADSRYSPFWEGVVVLPDRTDGEAVDVYRDRLGETMQNWSAEYAKLTRHAVMHCSVHLDEGHVRDGVAHYNAHAHVIVDRTDDRGRVIQLRRGELVRVQDLTAKVTGLRRGSTVQERRGAPARRHIGHKEWRAAQESGERRIAIEQERGRDEAVLYAELRELMKMSGLAKQRDYQDVKAIREDLPKLREALTDWRKLAGGRDGVHGDGHEEVDAAKPHRSSVSELYGELRGMMKASGLAKQVDYQEAKQHAQDAEWLIVELKRWRDMAELRKKQDVVREEAEQVETARERGRPGISGDDKLGKVWYLLPLKRAWDQERRCAVYRAENGDTWFIATRRRIEVVNQSDESLIAALKLASKKFDNRITITGPPEFRVRAARLAGRLGIEVLDADLATTVAAEKREIARDQPPPTPGMAARSRMRSRLAGEGQKPEQRESQKPGRPSSGFDHDR